MPGWRVVTGYEVNHEREYRHGRARTAKLATVRADGRPHVAPIWFVLDGEYLVFTTGQGTASLTSGDPDLLLPDDGHGGRYIGEERADEYNRCNAVEGELLVRIAPQKMLAYSEIVD